MSPPSAATCYRIRHSTTCRYTDAIQLAHHVLHLKPRERQGQRLLSYRLDLTPQPASVSEYVDYFGNPTTYLAMQEPHESLVVLSAMEVEVMPVETDAAATPANEELAQELALGESRAARQASRFAFASPLIPLLPELRDYALPSIAPGRAVAAAAQEIAERIFNDFAFDPVATSIATPIATVLRQRRGVCQDFAHVAVGCLRAVGLAARYVSGYLRTVPPAGSPRLVGADASHAWVSVWCGGEQWLDFDPTNGRPGSTDLVTLAWGRDYSDVSPMRGVLIGGGSQDLLVEVDVEPIEPLADGEDVAG